MINYERVESALAYLAKTDESVAELKAEVESLQVETGQSLGSSSHRRNRPC